ncbi:MAG: hypothetical protein IPK44_16545 [Candidatus Accumulibacter sp.]|jgi:hypothetical protein|uniref:hypothetical protein n=1 Tax=Accumulibacter sp. TaxID=2053492 RepID=UPI002587E980|nr:hypothetical protein [Accumulibacter sp.]MBK8115984.1 hypothetical protein [Accumulibacter sp.]
MTRFSRVAEKIITAVVGACVLLSTCPAVRAGDDLGRLFFTPERRQQLDRQREMNLLDKQQAPADPTLTVDGVVTRSSGKRTAWVNGNPQHENDAWSGLTVSTRAGNPAQVLIESGDAPAARARVGETVNRNTGESHDLLNGGRIRLRPASPAMQ